MVAGKIGPAAMKRQDTLSAPATGTASATHVQRNPASLSSPAHKHTSVLTPAALQVGKRINPPIPEKRPVRAGCIDQ
jgi:hypothetical protein